MSQEEAGPRLNQENSQTAQIKAEPEEQSITQRQEQVQEFTAVSVKSEDQPSLLPPRQTEEDSEETDRKDYILDPFQQFYSDNESLEDSEEWEPSAGCSARQMETEEEVHKNHSGKRTDKQNQFFTFNLSSTNNTSPESSVTVNNDRSE